MKALTTLIVIGMFAAATPVRAQSSVEGAWKIIEWWGTNQGQEWRMEDIQPSLWLFKDGHYSCTYLYSKRSPFPEGEPSRSEISADEWKSISMPFVSNAGSYEVTDSQITIHPMVALIPNFMGDDVAPTWEYRFEGDILHVTLARGGTHMRLRRLQ